MFENAKRRAADIVVMHKMGVSLGLGLRHSGPLDKVPAEFRAIVLLARDVAAELRANHAEVAEALIDEYLDHADKYVASLQPLAAVPQFNAVEAFAKRMLRFDPAALHTITFKEFFNRFKSSLSPKDSRQWSRIKVSRAIPEPFGTHTGNQNVTFVARARWAS